MPIQSRPAVHKIWRMGGDEVEIIWYAGQKVTISRCRMLQAGQGQVDSCHAQSSIIDIDKKRLCVRHCFRNSQATRTCTGANIDSPLDRYFTPFELGIHGVHELVGIGTEKYGVCGCCRESGVDEHVSIEAGKPDQASHSIFMFREHASFHHEVKHDCRQHMLLERTAPPEYIL